MPLLANAAELLSFATAENKEEFLETLQTLHEESGKKWRIRETIATHIYDYAKHYEPATIFKKIWGLAMLLCGDDVCKVRNSAAANIWRLLDLCRGEEFAGLMRSDVLTLAADTKCTCRQLYALICTEMSQSTELLESSFLNPLLELAKDHVVGVRLSLAKTIKIVANRNGIETRYNR